MFGINSEHVVDLLSKVAQWAPTQSAILAVALVGSYSRNAAYDTSDLDLVIIVVQPSEYLEDRHWLNQFGAIKREQLEDYGKVKSIRVWYVSGLEVEFGITDETWLELDEGTLQVVSKGMQIVFERTGILSSIKSKLSS